jgi:hypothetical protein
MAENTDRPNRTVPVLIDDLGEELGKAGEGSPSQDLLVRCIYFSIDASERMSDWVLNLQRQEIPFFLLGLSGIVYAPAAVTGGQPYETSQFLSPSDIEATFNRIESSRLSIETARIYLPRWIIDASPESMRTKPQDVLRIRQDLFGDAFRFARGQIAIKDFNEHLRRYAHEFRGKPHNELPLRVSPDETRAFRNWSGEQRTVAIHQFGEWVSRQETLPEKKEPNRRF